MCQKNNPSDDEILALASQDRQISRDELGIQTPSTPDGLQSLNEGFNFLQFNDQSKKRVLKNQDSFYRYYYK